MYNQIETCVANNGHSSTFFKPSRGIRQGCAISTNIFVLIVGLLAHVILQNNKKQLLKYVKLNLNLSIR
jgi:hypothetical protein